MKTQLGRKMTSPALCASLHQAAARGTAFRKSKFRFLEVIAAAAIAVTVCQPSIAQLTVWHTFQGTDGESPVGGLYWLGDGYFYGTTKMGGIWDYPNGDGTIFRIFPGITGFTTVYSFSQDPGFYIPYAGLTGFNGQLIGTSFAGGSPAATGAGLVFKAYMSDPNSWNFEGEYDFSENPNFTAGVNGGYPEAALVRGSDGNFYGTTSSGGTNDSGTVYAIDPTTFNLSTIYRFTGGADGGHPIGALVAGNSGITFYGTTQEGGTNNLGTVFSLAYVSIGLNHFWSLTTLHTFSGGADGGFPQGGLVLGNDGFLYGTTTIGGTNANPAIAGGAGTVWKLDMAGNFTVLHGFGNGAPNPLIQGTDGNLYGTTRGGSSPEPDGTIFQISTSGAFNTLWTFNGIDGRTPSGALVQYNGTLGIGSGSLVGTTAQGGTNLYGTVFSLPVATLGIGTNQVSNQSISMPQVAPGQASVSVVSAAGLTYQLESVDALGNTNWNKVGSPVTSSGGLLNLTDPTVSGVSERFYQVAITPSN